MDQESRKLFLLDAMALIYRAHFAFSRNPRINSKGQNTGVMLGFTNSLFEIITKQKPSHIGVAFDTFAPTFRDEVYKEYKANRQATPEDIKTGIPVVKEIIGGFNIPILELDGYEADDIIGTIAKKAVKEGFEIYMMTPDKDFGQLVEEKILLYKPSYMGNTVEILGPEEVKKKWDIQEVDQVRDMLGLQGDSSDNIPGIPGIGQKTAAKLLREFGTVENLVAHGIELKGKQQQLVTDFGEQGILSKDLATIKIDVPIEYQIPDLEYQGPDAERLKPVFEELEFKTLLQRILGESAGSAPQSQMSLFERGDTADQEAEVSIPTEKSDFYSVVHDYHLVDDFKTRKSLISFLKKQTEFCFTTDSSGEDPIEATLKGLAFAYFPGEAFYIPVPEKPSEADVLVGEFKEVLESLTIGKVGHNLKRDALILRRYDVVVGGSIFDSMLAHYVLEPDTGHALDILSQSYLDYSMAKDPGKSRDPEGVYPEDYERKAEKVDIGLQLKPKLVQTISTSPVSKVFYDVEIPLLTVLASMEFEGVRVAPEALSELSLVLEQETLKVQKEIYDQAGEEFNIASPKQLGPILFEKLQLLEKPRKTKSGQYATGEEILSKLAVENKIVQDILDYRQYSKLKSTYVDALPEMISPRDQRIHTYFQQAVAATGRLSSKNPNLQNIPIRTDKGKEIRKAFVPRDTDHILFSADYSQIELRIMASFAKDKQMIDAFRQGRDIHATTASRIFGIKLEEVDSETRRMAKSANFGMIYGISPFGLSQNLNIPRGEAKEIIESYFQEFPAVKEYMDRTVNEARDRGYVETILGRRRILRDINSRNATLRGYEERNAINAPIQGSAADIIKIAMINIQQWLHTENLKTKMILQVHDELVFDVLKEEQELVEEHVSELMRSAIRLEVPMEVDSGFGANWLEAH